MPPNFMFTFRVFVLSTMERPSVTALLPIQGLSALMPQNFQNGSSMRSTTTWLFPDQDLEDMEARELEGSWTRKFLRCGVQTAQWESAMFLTSPDNLIWSLKL